MSKGLVKAPTIENGSIQKYNRWGEFDEVLKHVNSFDDTTREMQCGKFEHDNSPTYQYIMSQLVTYKYEISINFHPSRFCFFSCRRRKGERIFLVAFYECNDDFELENLEQDRLYCSHEQWIGNVPKCTALEEESGAEDDEEEEEDEGKNRNCIQSICNEWLWNHQLPSFRVEHILLQSCCNDCNLSSDNRSENRKKIDENRIDFLGNFFFFCVKLSNLILIYCKTFGGVIDEVQRRRKISESGEMFF